LGISPSFPATALGRDISIEYLGKVNEITPVVAEFMRTDEDLKSVHDNPRFADVIAKSEQRALPPSTTLSSRMGSSPR